MNLKLTALGTGLLFFAVTSGTLAADDNRERRVPQPGSAPVPAATTINNGFKLVGWNDLGMHCMDGKDYSIFAVLPPYNTIHAHLMDSAGRLIKTGSGYKVTYEATRDPLTNSLNTTSWMKTNFWQFAAQLGFGSLKNDQGLKGASMPGSSNTPQPMAFNASDNTFLAEGIPILPYPDPGSSIATTNYFPMMRLVARNSSGALLAATDVVLPNSDEMSCNVCHASGTGSLSAMPAGGWVNHRDASKDVKLNILRKHDERFANTALYRQAAPLFGYNPQGLEKTSATTPVLCSLCHASNALNLKGVSGIASLTSALHSGHGNAIDPATSKPLGASNDRTSCYRCHPGPSTQCLRGAMSSVKDAKGTVVVECQSCHGSMSTVAASTRNGWLDEPNCQNCHTGTATSNNGQLVYNSVFASGSTLRAAVNSTFATNPDTPAKGLSLYRFSKGHGGLQCEACHGSTHAEYGTPFSNDNVQSNALQGHTGMLAECASCHGSSPNTTTGGPHGLHPLGQTWVTRHGDAAENGPAACQACHGKDYKGTLLSKALANRTFSTEWGTRTFARGAVIGCYSCHNGPKP